MTVKCSLRLAFDLGWRRRRAIKKQTKQKRWGLGAKILSMPYVVASVHSPVSEDLMAVLGTLACGTLSLYSGAA